MMAIDTKSQESDLAAPAAARSGSALLCLALQAHGVELIFGYPGGAALPLYRELARHPGLRHVLVRHEQNAALAADGYARVSGRPGVCLATSGPGATNLLTGIATAMMDSVPMVALTGQVARPAIGTQAFQEVDIVAMAGPVTKAAFQAREPGEVPRLVADAFRVAQEGRPGPVLIDLPKDVLMGFAEAELVGPLKPRPVVGPDLHLVLDELAALINGSERPVLLAGRGVVLAEATDSLRRVAELANLPTITTLLGIGVLPETHPLCFGMTGMHGTVASNLALHNADLVVGLGARFDDRVVGRAVDFAPRAKVAHVDVDPSAFGRVARCDLAVLGDVGVVLAGLRERLVPRRRDAWLRTLRLWVAEHGECLRPADDGRLLSPAVVRSLRRETGGAATVVADVGQHQMFAALHHGFEQPGSFLTSGGLGTMGYAIPAALGAKLARPEQEVWVVVGDGGFQMSAAELNTLATNHVAVKIAVLNNECLGMVRQWQELFYDGVYSQSILPQPDFVALSLAHRVPARRVERSSDLTDALRWARAIDGPALLDLRVPLEESVLPMVPAGACNGEVLCAEGRVLPAE